ncbi:MAG: Spy/CpxP family protein refolding chaperone [Aquabacterium sp.]
MRPWIKRTLIAIFGAGIIAATFGAWAHRHHHHHAMNWSAEDVAKWRGKLIDRAGSELKLDDAQKQRLGTLFDKLDEQRTALIGSTPQPRADIAQLIAGNTFDRARASALVTEKTGAVTTKSPQVIAAAADFYDSLNADQQTRVREFMARRGGRWGHGEHRGEHRGERHGG